MATQILPVHSREEIARAAALARTIWQEHYTPIIGTPQVEYMLEHFQNEQAITRQIGNGTDYFLLQNGGRDAGYFALVPEAHAVMLSKLYVESAFRKHGIAKAALRFIEGYCRAHGAPLLWLTVNRHNDLAVAWYGKMGFANAGPVVQEIGDGYVMDDYRMEKTVSPT
jgi:diamine N-acetyltransferase